MGVDVKWEREDGILIAFWRVESTAVTRQISEYYRVCDGPDDDALILDLAGLLYQQRGACIGVIVAWKFKEPGKQFGICTLADSVREAVSGFVRFDIYRLRQ